MSLLVKMLMLALGEALPEQDCYSLDGSNKTNDVEMGVSIGLELRDSTCRGKLNDKKQSADNKASLCARNELTLLQQDLDDTSPFFSEEISSSKRSISSTNDKAVDSLLDKMQGSELSTFLSSD